MEFHVVFPMYQSCSCKFKVCTICSGISPSLLTHWFKTFCLKLAAKKCLFYPASPQTFFLKWPITEKLVIAAIQGGNQIFWNWSSLIFSLGFTSLKYSNTLEDIRFRKVSLRAIQGPASQTKKGCSRCRSAAASFSVLTSFAAPWCIS